MLQAMTIVVRARMDVLSVANTSVLWWGQGLGTEAEKEADLEILAHAKGGRPGIKRKESILRDYRKDHRLLATCESGPPLEVRVPELQTIGWDRLEEAGTGENLATRRGKGQWFSKMLGKVQEVGDQKNVADS
jgi:hypothetical protein